MADPVGGREAEREGRGLVCALCGKTVRSVYSAPGEYTVRFCAECFFKEPKETD